VRNTKTKFSDKPQTAYQETGNRIGADHIEQAAQNDNAYPMTSDM
jgi:hypothetical protein